MFYAIVFGLLVTLVAGRQRHENPLDIVNGTLATIPYQAFLVFHDSLEKWYCGGSLISQNYVLTAGACTLQRSGTNQSVSVFLGTFDVTNPYEEGRMEIQSNEIITHEGLVNGLRATDNIGLIKLPNPVVYTQSIQPISLLSRSDLNDSLVGSIGIISGWGSTEPFTYEDPTTLHIGNITIIPNTQCSSIAQFNKETQLCASSAYSAVAYAICDHDLGGPLIVHDHLAGIIFYSSPICDTEYPQMFIKVSSYFDWIEENSDVIIEE